MERFLVLISFLVSLSLATGCHTEAKGEREGEETEFLITSPLVRDTLITKEYVCQIRSIRHIEVRALEKGYLKDIYVDEGQFVKQGQLMFKILPNIYEAEMQSAKAEARVAEIEYLNTKSLADSNIVSQNELAVAEARYEKAKAELALAQVHLGFTEIRAPFSGIMDRFHVRHGSLVDEGELLTSLSDNSKMWVYFNVPEPEYLDYKMQAHSDDMTKVSLMMANHQMFEHPGVVETIEADFNNETGNISFRATFPNPDGLLRHGETGNVRITTPIKDAMLIPQKATFEVLDKRYVFVINDENKVEPREIDIAQEMPHLYVVASGLETTDKILLEGLRLVKRGDEIQTHFQDPDEVIGELELYAE